MGKGRGRGGRGRGGSYYDARLANMDPEAARAQMEADDRLVPFIRGREVDAGDLSGEVMEPVIAVFTYFGKQFRANPDLTETMVVDLLEAGESTEVNDPRQLLAAKDYARDHLHPEDFDDFWETAVANRQGIQQIMRVCWRLLEQVTERPTSPPSDSSDGRRDTPTNSADGASGQVIDSEVVTPTPAAGNVQQVADHFIHKFEAQGRPDLANQIALAAESRVARGLVTV